MKKAKKDRNENEKWIVNYLGTEGAKTISESLKVNTSLTELNLGCDEKIRKEKERTKWKEMKKWIDNEIGTEGAKTISESLKINTSLTELNLGGYEKVRMKENKRNEQQKKNE